MSNLASHLPGPSHTITSIVVGRQLAAVFCDADMACDRVEKKLAQGMGKINEKNRVQAQMLVADLLDKMTTHHCAAELKQLTADLKGIMPVLDLNILSAEAKASHSPQLHPSYAQSDHLSNHENQRIRHENLYVLDAESGA